MSEQAVQLQRLEAIGRSLASCSGAKTLIGLGSVGLELDRLDAWSDLDFFVIVDIGEKHRFLNNLDWLENVSPIAYAFKNTPDGYKLLFADGIFCEFAVFEPQEIRNVPFNPGRVIWSWSPDDDHFAIPSVKAPTPEPPAPEWLLGEALTNLLVGLLRFQRGEKLSAARFVQQYAVDRVVGLAYYLESEQLFHQDPFSPERRVEQRYPWLAQRLPEFVQGYERSPQSALAILAFLETHFDVNTNITARIKQLAR